MAWLIPLLIIVAFTTKGLTLYLQEQRLLEYRKKYVEKFKKNI